MEVSAGKNDRTLWTYLAALVTRSVRIGHDRVGDLKRGSLDGRRAAEAATDDCAHSKIGIVEWSNCGDAGVGVGLGVEGCEAESRWVWGTQLHFTNFTWAYQNCWSGD